MNAPKTIVTGMGLLSPIGHGRDAFWEALLSGRSAARPVRSFDTSGWPRNVGCEIDALPAAEPPFDAAAYGGGRCMSLWLAALRDALDDAGITPTALAGRRIAVLAGTTMGEFGCIERLYADGSPQPPPPGAFDDAVRNSPGALSRVAARAIARPDAYCNDVFGACAAGNMALIMAKHMIEAGECDLVIAGGADAFSRFAFIGFMRNRVMAKETCRPYDRQRDGLLVGEGAAAFIVEPADRPLGRRRHARLLGGGTTCDAFNPTQPRPDGAGIIAAIRSTERDAGVPADDVDYVCSHGTGTPRNDTTEWQAIDRCSRPGTPFSSIKALTGHTMGAAGALEAAACMLSMRHGRLIPNWNLEHADGDFATRPVLTADSADLQTTANLSFGFGGYNSCLFLGRIPEIAA